MSTRDNHTMVSTDAEQHSLVKSIALHLLPSVLILVFFIIVALGFIFITLGVVALVLGWM